MKQPDEKPMLKFKFACISNGHTYKSFYYSTISVVRFGFSFHVRFHMKKQENL